MPLDPAAFLPADRGRVHDLLAEARARLARYREAEAAAGLSSPESGDLARHLRAAVSMLTTGVEMWDWELVAEGLVTVQDVETRARRLSP
jgi:hypothetical protein